MMPRITRVTPNLPVQSYMSWEVRAPLVRGADFWRQATCAEIDCRHYLHGWETRVDESTDLGQAQAHYIRHDGSRRHTETRRPDGLTAFTYPPGQTCFQASTHRTRTGRPALFLKRGGDWRAVTSPAQHYERDDQWVDDFAAHQQRLVDAQQ